MHNCYELQLYVLMTIMLSCTLIVIYTLCAPHFVFQITRVQVDSFDKGKRIPSCHLQADCRKEVPTDLKHVVHLKGAKSPDNAFIISVLGKRNNITTLC